MSIWSLQIGSDATVPRRTEWFGVKSADIAIVDCRSALSARSPQIVTGTLRLPSIFFQEILIPAKKRAPVHPDETSE
ncbi:hypothetical protein FM113_16055 [Leucobacter sp. 7(1)]|uniref:hypothetical protein n=1 Tax=Leucobacter sp. 7(1) TaxID=1255613 RepID=UPI00097EE31D|nr:hypothetical protein [Leucobacter sp. 7(1)]SJN12871.1 hypothetical protein FM113_16055 [Leucobacter sp. 7(1)]